MILYAVWIERDRGEYDYVRERKGNSWTDSSPVMIFDTKEAAQEESDKWNTGQVVEYSSTDKIYGIS
tara:strand:- start:386 stop:586 length:201 start_codon:yes stop_codon:yes gene_type:complete